MGWLNMAAWADFIKGQPRPGWFVTVHIKSWAEGKNGKVELEVERLQGIGSGDDSEHSGIWTVEEDCQLTCYPRQLKCLDKMMDTGSYKSQAYRLTGDASSRSAFPPYKLQSIYPYGQQTVITDALPPTTQPALAGPLSPPPAGATPPAPAGETCGCGLDKIAVTVEQGPRRGQVVCLTCGRRVA